MAGRGSLGGLRAWLAALAAIVAMFSPALAHAGWLKAESRRFIIYSNGDEQTLREQTRKLEAFDTLLRALHGLPPEGVPPRRLEIYLVRDIADLRTVAPDMSEGVRGFYSSGEDSIHAVAILQHQSDRTLLHEYTHHFMLQYFPYPYPAWLVEGYAEYFGASDVGADQIEVGLYDENRASNLLVLDWVKPGDLLTKHPWQFPRVEQTASFYGQSWLLTHWFMSDQGRYAQLQAYMKAVGGGQDSVAAMQAATGMSPNTLERTLKAYLRSGLRYTRYKAAAPGPITMSPLPASADDLLLLGLRVRAETKGNADLLKLVRDRAALYPGDREAILMRARAEVRYGDAAAGETLLRDFLAAHPDDAEALVALGQARLKAATVGDTPQPAQAREAGKLFARAFRLDPTAYQALYGYALTRKVEAGYPSDNDLEALLAAQELAPQVSEITIEAARASMKRREWARARALLAPVATKPHGDGAEIARKLLIEIDAADPKPPAS